ncbi:MAG: alpha/beta hydrolase [Sphingomonadaceae bacterium]
MSLPPLFLIHGMWSRPSTFATLRDELEAAGIRSAAVTLPGHDVPPGAAAPALLSGLGLADYVAALERDAAVLDEPPVILGHSMGGLLAQLLACRIAHRGLVLLSTAPSAQAQALSWEAVRTMWPITRRWGFWRGPTLLDAQSARAGVFNGVPEEEARPALAELTWDSGRVLRQIAMPWSDGTRGSRVDYGRLTRPALVVTGLDDRIVPPAVSRKTARLLAAAGARVDYEEWPGVGHWLFHDAVRPKLAAAIARFVATV